MKKNYIFHSDAAFEMQQLAREQMKLKLLADVAMDMTICKIERWDHKKYILEIIEILESIVNRD